MTTNSLNIEQIIAVAEQLKELKDQIVFVGGSTTALLVDTVGTSQARQTEDVDFIVNITAVSEHHQFEQQMRNLGFLHDQSEDAPICRWLMDFHETKLKVDAMPTNEEILGFGNCWYSPSINTAWSTEIKDGLTIKVIDPVYFLGTKFEAYNGRGNGQIFSHDIEDIIYVLEHRSTIETDVYNANDDIKGYLTGAFEQLLSHPDLENTLPGIVDGENATELVLGKMKFIASQT